MDLIDGKVSVLDGNREIDNRRWSPKEFLIVSRCSFKIYIADDDDTSHRRCVSNVVYILETMLPFHCFLKKQVSASLKGK